MGPLSRHVPGNTNINPDCKMHEMIRGNGMWNLKIFWVWLPKDIVRCIISIIPFIELVSPDFLSWYHTTLEVFFLLKVLIRCLGMSLRTQGMGSGTPYGKPQDLRE